MTGQGNVARDLVAGGSPGVFVYIFEHPAQGKVSVPGTGPGSCAALQATLALAPALALEAILALPPSSSASKPLNKL